MIAHGIGHAVLHRDLNYVRLHLQGEVVDEVELEAECFAFNLLVDLVDQSADLYKLAAYYGVPAVKMMRYVRGERIGEEANNKS